MRPFDDSAVRSVAENLSSAPRLTMQQFVHEIDRLFNRMTFRYERTWQCGTQNWDQRLNAALQTWRLLEDYRSFVEHEGGASRDEYESLIREVYRYCNYMLSHLFEEGEGLSPLKDIAGDTAQLLGTLPAKKWFADLKARQSLKETDMPRCLAIEHMNALLEAFAIRKFDVFLSYSRDDTEAVHQLERLLKTVPLKVWLDKEQLRPGLDWFSEAETAIKDSASVAVGLGPGGVGLSQQKEIEAAVNFAGKHGRPVIPVILPGVRKEPDFGGLENRTWVDLRDGFTDDGIGRLVFGITGQKPAEFT